VSSESTIDAASLEARARSYGQAWNDHDLEAICAMHTDDIVMRLGGAGGVTEVAGLDKVREIYGYLLAAWPDQHIETHKVVVRDGLCVMESELTGTLSLPWQMGDETFEPNGQKVTFALVDVLEFDGDRIANKTSLIDGIAIRQQLAG
jgi:predicted ester cyclase